MNCYSLLEIRGQKLKASIVMPSPCSCSDGVGIIGGGAVTGTSVSGEDSPLLLLVCLKVSWNSDESETLLGASQDCNGRSGLESLLRKIPEEQIINSYHSFSVSAPKIPLTAPRKDSPYDVKH